MPGTKGVFLKDFFSRPEAKFRAAAIGGAAFLGLAALFLGFTLAGSLFGLSGLSSPLGDLFARSYGILAFLIPAHLGYAAFILADPHWRPGRIFMLSVSLFPFLTLAVGFAFIRDFEIRARQFAVLDFSGKTGFSFIIVLFTVLEILILWVIKNLLFSGPQESGGLFRCDRSRRKGFLLPAPRPKLTEVYAEAAAGKTGQDRNGELPSADRQAVDPSAPPAFRLPELKPLNSSAAFRDLNREDAEIVEEDAEIPEDFDDADTIEDLEDIDENGEISGTGDRPGRVGGVAVDVEQALSEAAAAGAAHRPPPRHTGRLSTGAYRVPVEILNQYPDGEYWIIDQATRDAALTLKETLEEFKIQAEVTGIRKGPVITMFEILPAPGVKLSRIVNLQDNIALRLAASSVRMLAPIPGKHAVGIEVPNAKRNIVSFREIIEGELQREGKKPEVPVILGKDITGEAVTVDLVQMPHLLIAGATGSGKSVCVNAMILSILYQRQPSECRLILIDPKIVELKLYNDIPHLLTPVITEPKRAFQALQYCIYEMERRYACLDSMGVRDIRSYNKRVKERRMAAEHIPYIVVVIDEFADLMATTGKELESTVARLAAMSRAVGIHLVLATQRPSIDVITGLIKANIPSRIAFMVASKMDSRIIIDMVGAEKLLGKG
ncbi:MAG: DNA translocase FtsK, partial [Treponema sp.]|nr:DNA translocase FtsK [Treponema sp.]